MANLSITASDIRYDKDPIFVEVAEAGVAGDIYAEDRSAETWSLAGATADDGLVRYGVALANATSGQTFVPMAVTLGKLTLGEILTKGEIYVLSATDGKIAPIGDLVGPTNEVQTLEVSGATSGTFTLTFAGQTTSDIAYNATAADVETALEALSNIDAVSTTGGPLNSSAVEITFEGENAGKDVALMTVTDSTDGTVSVTETTAGYGGDYLFILGYAESTSVLGMLSKYTGIQMP